MAEIRNVNTQLMRDTADKIAKQIEEWSTEVDKIFQQQQELDGMWDGHANDLFNQQWADDRTKYQKLIQLMQEYCDAIIAAANRYDQTEGEVLEVIKS